MNVEELISRQRAGFTLEQPFYNSADIFRLDMAHVIAGQWLYVDHASSLPNTGDYIVYDIAGESVIIVRGEGGELHAHFNVCRHRGSRICLEARGAAKRLVCPYHAWAYALDGRLLHARQMGESFDRARYTLAPCAVREYEGLVFINLGEREIMDFDRLASHVGEYVEAWQLTSTRVVHRELYPTHANWKLVVENFRECYHCTPSHPEYAKVNAYVQAWDRRRDGYDDVISKWDEEHRRHGAPGGFERWSDPIQPHNAWRQPIRPGFLTLTEDGAPVAPLLGRFEQYDGSESGVFFGALSYLYMANDHATVFRFTPIHAAYTEVEVSWLVSADAEEADYDLQRLKWLWDVTTQQDTKIINDNQCGVNSSRYVPGPYSEVEGGSERFVGWYLERLRKGMTSEPLAGEAG